MEKKERKTNKFYKTNPSGISLIVLVITTIVIIILATAVIVTILDNNPIASAIRAVDESNVAKYTEQIEQIRSKLLLQNENHELPNLQQMKEALEKEKWVVETEMIMDEGIEKLKIVSKEGYIFYITEEGAEYKGKGEVVDTGALKRDDVLELVAQDTTSNGQYVKITSKAEAYYKIKYKIGEENDNWTEIKSGEKVEVPYGNTIYAKLFYGSNSGVEFKLKIGDANPSIVAKNIDTSNMKRKTDNAFASLFDITWGVEGTGTTKYEVTGNMLFRGQEYSNTEIENIKELELGTYNVKCIVTSPSGYEVSAQKQVSITMLANTSVENELGQNINANAIYSQYDLAYLRDVVNSVNGTNNAKLMESINMSNVCSVSSQSWLPIGNVNKKYEGVFEGNNNAINNIYIDTTNEFQGLFGCVENSTLKNITLQNGSISGGNRVGGIVGYAKESILENLKNIEVNVNSKTNYIENGVFTATLEVTEVKNFEHSACSIGGICGVAENSNINYCNNNSDTIRNASGNYVGGIVGYAKSNKNIEIANCTNLGTVFSVGDFTGGIVGMIYGDVDIKLCSNESGISSNETAVGGIAGGIVGGSIKECNNARSISGKINVGGICGYAVNDSTTDYAVIEDCSNSAEIISYSSENLKREYYQITLVNAYQIFSVGGIVGFGDRLKINRCYNEENSKISLKNNFYTDYIYGVGGLCGEIRNGNIQNCYNKCDIEYNANSGCVGGIVGIAYYNSYIQNCYNIASISGSLQIGGIIGQGTQTNIRHCYNRGNINGTNYIGGVAGILNAFKAEEYTNNYLYYCYNIGDVSGTSNVGTINGSFDYYDIDYIYSLKNSKYIAWGNVNHYINALNQKIFESEAEVMNSLLLDTKNNFKEDYEGKNSVNDGYPILNWQ